MKTLRIQIQVILLTVCIATAVIVSGYLAYQSLSKIVDTIHKEARPDLKLLLIKDIAADLSEVENTIRLYSLTGNSSFARSYRQLGDSIQRKLNMLSEYSIPGSEEISHIDSISLFANRKLIVWDKIRALHRSKTDTHNSFSNLYSKIDTAIIQPDTIRFKAEPKKSFFKRIFGKRDTTTKQPVIIDKSKEKEIIKKEIADIEEQISTQTKQLQSREAALFEQNIKVTQELNRHIESLEASERKHLENKTREVDQMADKTYRGMAAFSIAAVIFLILILILIFRNLQKNRVYQQVLKKAKAEAESLAKAKEMFVATVSHEMRTPVNAIYGLTGQMLRKTGPTEMVNDLKVVHKSAEHLITLVNDTLDFSKIESQKLKIEQIDFLPDEILNEIQILHKESAQKKGINLIISNKTDKDLVLKGDPIRLKQILINLITNAIKFTQQGQVTLSVSGEDISPRTYKLHIEVEDTGIGISKEDLNLIFDEFVQVGSDLTQKQRGAGLGLSIVKKLVLLQDGEISVESTPGKGTRFILQIPFRPGNPENVIRIQSEQLQAPSWFANLHFLIVDDEEFNLYLIRNILNNWGVSYTEAHNGQEAVELASKTTFDMILMDIRMPILDGFEAAQQILRQNPTALIIALTATTKPEDIHKISQAGMHAFLPKPFPEEDLISTILKLIPEKMSTAEVKINGDELIDMKELERIAGGDKAFLNEMLRIFIRSSEEAMVKFRQNIQNSDRIALAEIAHKLAAPSKHMHATTLYDHLKKLENSAESLNSTEIEELMMIIEDEINQINLFLKQKLEGS